MNLYIGFVCVLIIIYIDPSESFHDTNVIFCFWFPITTLKYYCIDCNVINNVINNVNDNNCKLCEYSAWICNEFASATVTRWWTL